MLFAFFALAYLMVGLIQSVGYFGSTSLRSVSANDKIWTDFTGLFKNKQLTFGTDIDPLIIV